MPATSEWRTCTLLRQGPRMFCTCPIRHPRQSPRTGRTAGRRRFSVHNGVCVRCRACHSGLAGTRQVGAHMLSRLDCLNDYRACGIIEFIDYAVRERPQGDRSPARTATPEIPSRRMAAAGIVAQVGNLRVDTFAQLRRCLFRPLFRSRLHLSVHKTVHSTHLPASIPIPVQPACPHHSLLAPSSRQGLQGFP